MERFFQIFFHENLEQKRLAVLIENKLFIKHLKLFKLSYLMHCFNGQLILKSIFICFFLV